MWYSPVVTVCVACFNTAVLGDRRCDVAGVGAGVVTWHCSGVFVSR